MEDIKLYLIKFLFYLDIKEISFLNEKMKPYHNANGNEMLVCSVIPAPYC